MKPELEIQFLLKFLGLPFQGFEHLHSLTSMVRLATYSKDLLMCLAVQVTSNNCCSQRIYKVYPRQAAGPRLPITCSSIKNTSPGTRSTDPLHIKIWHAKFFSLIDLHPPLQNHSVAITSALPVTLIIVWRPKLCRNRTISSRETVIATAPPRSTMGNASRIASRDQVSDLTSIRS